MIPISFFRPKVYFICTVQSTYIDPYWFTVFSNNYVLFKNLLNRTVQFLRTYHHIRKLKISISFCTVHFKSLFKVRTNIFYTDILISTKNIFVRYFEENVIFCIQFAKYFYCILVVAEVIYVRTYLLAFYLFSHLLSLRLISRTVVVKNLFLIIDCIYVHKIYGIIWNLKFITNYTIFYVHASDIQNFFFFIVLE